TVEKRGEDGTWDLKAVYSPEAWKLSQGFDYCQMLYQELERLGALLEGEFSWDLVREIEQVERELEATHKAGFRPAERVPQAWARPLQGRPLCRSLPQRQRRQPRADQLDVRGRMRTAAAFVGHQPGVRRIDRARQPQRPRPAAAPEIA